MKREYSKLRGLVKEKFKKEYALADKLKCSRASLSLKLNGHVDFTQKEIEDISKFLGIAPGDIHTYFFCNVV